MELADAVSILKYLNGKDYTGFTRNFTIDCAPIEKERFRLRKTKLPLSLVHLSLFKHKLKAYDFERYLKWGLGWRLGMSGWYELSI